MPIVPQNYTDQITASVVLKRDREASLQRKHTWLFSGAVARVEGKPLPGDLVRICTAEGKAVALGFYEGESIFVRIISFSPDTFTDIETLLHERLFAAFRLRKSLGLMRPDNNVFRLVYGEGDALPGLIVDIYGSTAVLQAHTAAMYRRRQIIATLLQEIFPEQGIRAVFDKSAATLPETLELSTLNSYLIGTSSDEPLYENGLRIAADWIHGQKTGFFIDQRENRALVAQHAASRRVLNLFSYTGGFSLYALRGGATEVVSLDSSKRATEAAEDAVKLNFDAVTASRHQTVTEDAFDYLNRLEADRFDLIIVDPPAFAKRRGNIKNALNGYRKLNRAVLEKVAPGGLVFTFSCSQLVSAQDFRLALLTASLEAGRSVRILRQLGQAPCHPINICHPETEYLKGLLLYVE